MQDQEDVDELELGLLGLVMRDLHADGGAPRAEEGPQEKGGFLRAPLVGLGLVPTDPLARMFTEILGRANQLLAGIAQRVIFVSCGLELVLKNTGKTR